MHIALCLVYGLAIWSAILTYTIATGGPVAWVLAGAPFVISGTVAMLLAMDLALERLVAFFRKRRTA